MRRSKEARQPKFQTGIRDQSFEQTRKQLEDIRFTGPCGLSCDDTKLFATFRLYWDSEKKMHFLLGGTGEPLQVADPEQLQEVLDLAELEKATKVSITV